MDARRKKLIWVLGVASPILVWRVSGLITEYAPANAQADPLVNAVDFTVAVDSPDPADAHDYLSPRWQQQEAAAQQPWGRDPFVNALGMIGRDRPAQANDTNQNHSAAPQPPSSAFTGASTSNGRWLAVIGDRIVGVGDVIDDRYEVVEITEWSTTLVSGRWAFRLELGSPEAVVHRMAEK